MDSSVWPLDVVPCKIDVFPAKGVEVRSAYTGSRAQRRRTANGGNCSCVDQVIKPFLVDKTNLDQAERIAEAK